MRINFYDLRLTDSGSVTLAKESGVNYEAEKMNSPEEVALLAEQVLGLTAKVEEHIYMLSLNSACRATGVFLLSKGTVNAALVSPREIYIRALLTGAVQIVLIHNHPSGTVVPTEEDRKVTERVKQAGEILNIPLADHVIIGGGNGAYLSFKEAGLL